MNKKIKTLLSVASISAVVMTSTMPINAISNSSYNSIISTGKLNTVILSNLSSGDLNCSFRTVAGLINYLKSLKEDQNSSNVDKDDDCQIEDNNNNTENNGSGTDNSGNETVTDPEIETNPETDKDTDTDDKEDVVEPETTPDVTPEVTPDTKPDNNTDKPETDNSTDNDSSSNNFYSFQQEVVRLVNVERNNRGLSSLTFNSQLSNVATKKSQDMIDNNYFSHNSPTYGSPFDMMKQFGISYRTAGENIAMGQQTPQEVVNAWMNSQGHRENILKSDFTEIGIGVASDGSSLYWTQMFIGK